MKYCSEWVKKKLGEAACLESQSEFLSGSILKFNLSALETLHKRKLTGQHVVLLEKLTILDVRALK